MTTVINIKGLCDTACHWKYIYHCIWKHILYWLHTGLKSGHNWTNLLRTSSRWSSYLLHRGQHSAKYDSHDTHTVRSHICLIQKSYHFEQKSNITIFDGSLMQLKLILVSRFGQLFIRSYNLSGFRHTCDEKSWVFHEKLIRLKILSFWMSILVNF